MAAQGTTTATIVFTDVVDSTGLRTGLGETAADKLFVEHQRQLGHVVSRHGGRVVKAAGDGVMAAFRSASDAVNAAVDLQRHVSAATPVLPVRVGAAAGDVAWQDDDCFGLPVVTAARLQAEASGGQILVSNIVRLLAGDRAGAPFESVGLLELKGLADAVEAYTVDWAPAAGGGAVEAGRPPMPLALAVTPEHRLVGREVAMSWLRCVQEDSRSGPGRVVLISGEAGAGKTRLAAELAAEFHAAGACVVHGGCDSDLALPYQPWVQASDQVLAAMPRDSLSDDLVSALSPLAGLLAHADWLGTAARRASPDAGAERYHTYRAFDAVLAEAASRWPTLVVLDDLHWAGTQTLALLRHLARTGLPAGVLVVGTYRDTGDEISEPLAACLADLRRVEGVDFLRLGALNATDVECFVADALDQRLDDDLRGLAALLAERTGGNAFFLGKLWHALVESGAVSFDGDHWTVTERLAGSVVPGSVRDVVADRLARLTEPARRFVDLAALCGERVDLQVLEAASDLSSDELDVALSELLDAGLLTRVSGSALVYRFAHALVRDAARARIAPLASVRLHGRLAEAIEAVHEADRRPVLAELAAHFAAAGGPPDKVVYYGRRAAAQSTRAAAYDEAVAHLQNVLAVTPHSAQRCATLIQLAGAQVRQGAFDASCEACLEAFDIAVSLGDSEAAAEAAIGYETARTFPGLSGEPSVELLRTALRMLGEQATARRAHVMGNLGRALVFSGRTEEGVRTGEAALRLAHAVGDDEVVAVVLQSLVNYTYDRHRHLALSTELAELSDRLGDPWSSAWANANLIFSLIALGRCDEAAELLERQRIISTVGHFATYEFMVHAFDATLALAAADLAGAEEAAERARAKGEADSSPYEAGVYGLQIYAIRRAQGRLAEVAPLMRAVANSGNAPAMWRPGLAALYAELGMLDDARAVFDDLAPDGFAAVPRDGIWPGSLTFLAETCVALADRGNAPVLYAELLAMRGQNLQAGLTICFGPADRLLGSLAMLLGRPADADEHFQGAAELADRCRSPLWAAEVQYDWAVALAARDPARARELGRQAIATAKEFGIGRLADRPVPGDGVTAVEPATVALPDHLSEREAEVLRLVAVGLSNQRIGAELYISQNTVANHVQAILRKSGCANRTEASLYAVRHGLVAGA